MIDTSKFRKGLKVEIDGQPFIMTESQFVKPGKGQAFNRCKFKNLISGATLERTYKSGESIAKADIVDEEMQFLYQSGDDYVFMNNRTYEQLELPSDQLGDAKNYLTENLEVQIQIWNGKPISVEPPNFVELEITQCDPGVRGDTVSGATKPATMSTGHVVHVPLFIEQGEWLRIDTRTGEYVDRVKK
ncbi:MAG: elongation factor P [Acidobacteriota bacterium]